MKHLAIKIKDPEQPTKMVRQLFVFCRWHRTDGKYEILNIALIWLSKFMIYKSYIGVDLSDINIFIKAQLQPNTVATSFRMLFSRFSEECITFSLAKHFNRIGTFFSVFPNYWRRPTLNFIYFTHILCCCCIKYQFIFHFFP